MIFWLDWKLFGNGYGLASPHFDDVFYWLSGRFYTFSGGLGAQLYSNEWRMPAPGTRRKLFGRIFVVADAYRCWWRVRVSWQLLSGVKEYSEVQKLKEELDNWGHGR